MLTGANVVGYVKCRRDAGAKLSQMAGQFIGKQIMKEVYHCVCVCVHTHCVCLCTLTLTLYDILVFLTI